MITPSPGDNNEKDHSRLLLSGCAAEIPEPEAPVPATTSVTEPAPAGCYDPNSLLEAATNGAVRCYPLRDVHCSSMLTMDKNILLIAASEYSSELTLLAGEDLHPAGKLHISSWLSRDVHSLHRWEKGISFYEEGTGQTLVLDDSLQLVDSIDAPEGLIGEPILSFDRRTLYYCTADSLRALELETGISRCLKEMDYPYQVLAGLHQKDTVLECTYRDGSIDSRTMFLSTDTGATLYTLYSEPDFYSHGDCYYTEFTESSAHFRLFGNADSQTRSLNLPQNTLCYFLPEDNAAVTMESLGLVCMFPITPFVKRKLGDRFETAAMILQSLFALGVLVFCGMLLMGGTYNPFIYFRF